MKKVWFLFLLIFAVSCSDDSTSPTDGDVKLSKTQSDWLYPVTVGNKWVYRFTYEDGYEFYGIKTFTMTCRITTYLGMFDWINSGRDDEAKTYECVETGYPEFEKYTGKFLGFNGSLTDIVRGDSKFIHQTSYNAGPPYEPVTNADLEIEDPLHITKYIGIEDVIIDGKIYNDCHKFEERDDDGEDCPIFARYYKLGVGLVKTEIYYMIDGIKELELTVELTSYSIK